MWLDGRVTPWVKSAIWRNFLLLLHLLPPPCSPHPPNLVWSEKGIWPSYLQSMSDFSLSMTSFLASADGYYSSISSKILTDFIKLAIYMKNELWLLTKIYVLILYDLRFNYGESVLRRNKIYCQYFNMTLHIIIRAWMRERQRQD